MARYTDLNVQQIDHLAKQFDLSIDSFRPMEGGATNSSYLLESRRGKYVLTVYEDKPVAQIAIMGRTLLHLAKHNYPTVVAVPTSDGDAAVEYEGKPVSVKEYIQGRVVKHMDADMLAQVGEALATLHQIPVPDYLGQKHPYGLEMFSTFIGLDIDDDFDTWLLERIDYLEENTPADLPKALIHGDMFYDNVLFQGGTLKALIDFEEVCNYYKVFDLGMALLGCCAVDGKLDLQTARAFTAGYLGNGMLQENERNTLQLMVETAATALASWRFWKYNLHNPTPDRLQKHWEMANIADQVHAIPKDEFMTGVFNS